MLPELVIAILRVAHRRKVENQIDLAIHHDVIHPVLQR